MVNRFAVFGGGRMAGAIANAASAAEDVEIVAVVARTRPDWLDGVEYFSTLDAMKDPPGLLIDFTLPEGTQSAALWCQSHQVPLLSGVTGLGDEAMSALQSAAKVVPVLWGANMGLGINVLAELIRRASAMLNADTPVEILDIHHQWKKDAPSGTALMLGEQVNAGRSTGDAGAVGYESIRIGEVVGEHRVSFQLHDEVITLSHAAEDRSVFAKGAVHAAQWLIKQSPGMYSPADWIANQR